MKTAELKQKLHDYIENAEEKKLKAIYIMVEDDIDTPYNYLDDKDFMTELERRVTELESGKEKGVTWDAVKKKIDQTLHSA